MTRSEILEAARKCVCGEREQDYGTPENNFKRISDLWSAYMGIQFSEVDVAMMMALLKVARIKTGTGTDDSFVDLAGYAACAGEITEEIKRKSSKPADELIIKQSKLVCRSVQRICGSCAHWNSDNVHGAFACVNPESDKCSEFTLSHDTCECWVENDV